MLKFYFNFSNVLKSYVTVFEFLAVICYNFLKVLCTLIFRIFVMVFQMQFLLVMIEISCDKNLRKEVKFRFFYVIRTILYLNFIYCNMKDDYVLILS